MAADELSNEQMDSMVAEHRGDGPTRSEAPPAPQATVTPVADETFKFKANGKEISAKRDQVLQWASQGHDYSQKMSEYNRLLQEYQSKQDAITQTESKYKPVEDYIQQNPGWWDHVQKSWQERAQQAQANPAMQEMDKVRQELADIKKFKEEILTEKQLTKQREEDGALDEEIKSIRSQYKDVDFNQIDATGSSLQQRILKHAIDSNINSFRAAFRDYYHDQLLALSQEKAKESVKTDLQKQTKLGILGKSQTPLRGIKEAKNIRSQSYNDLLSEAISELRGA